MMAKGAQRERGENGVKGRGTDRHFDEAAKVLHFYNLQLM